MRVIVRRRTHIFLTSTADGRNHIGVRPNLHLDSSRLLLQKVVKILLLKKARIIAAFYVDGVNFQEVAGVVATRFHFNFRRVHKFTLPFSAWMRSPLAVMNIYSKQSKEKHGHMKQVNFVKYPILNRTQKRDIVNVSKGNTVYVMLLSIGFCVDAKCSATGTSRSAVFFCLEFKPIIAKGASYVNYIL